MVGLFAIGSAWVRKSIWLSPLPWPRWWCLLVTLSIVGWLGVGSEHEHQVECCSMLTLQVLESIHPSIDWSVGRSVRMVVHFCQPLAHCCWRPCLNIAWLRWIGGGQSAISLLDSCLISITRRAHRRCIILIKSYRIDPDPPTPIRCYVTRTHTLSHANLCCCCFALSLPERRTTGQFNLAWVQIEPDDSTRVDKRGQTVMFWHCANSMEFANCLRSKCECLALWFYVLVVVDVCLWCSRNVDGDADGKMNIDQSTIRIMLVSKDVTINHCWGETEWTAWQLSISIAHTLRHARWDMLSKWVPNTLIVLGEHSPSSWHCAMKPVSVMVARESFDQPWKQIVNRLLV